MSKHEDDAVYPGLPAGHPGFQWIRDINCEGVDWQAMFAKAGHVLDPEVKTLCLECPVWRECLTHSFRNPFDDRPMTGGYFAGFSPGERKNNDLETLLALGEEERAATKAATPAAA